jgi:dTDP-glucose pyrophosphorylase
VKNREKIFIEKEASIYDALKLMDLINFKLLLVLNGNKFFSLLSIGDLQRAILNNISLETQIAAIVRKNVRFAKPNFSLNLIREMMINYRMEFCPVIDNQLNVKKIYFWDDIFQNEKIEQKEKFNLPVVIMAGGMGNRMKPITNVIPKPLIPIGDKTILEMIMNSFYDFGCNKFYLSVNYKHELIQYYLKEQNLPFKVSFFKENKPLGTAGSLSLLKNKIKSTFFVSNCDILVNQDYSEVLKYHRENKNKITIIAAVKTFEIAYGTINTLDDGIFESISEKPNLNFKINTGMYILEPDTLNEIPENTFFHITDLIQRTKDSGHRIGVFPISEKSWKDIGNWTEYLKTINVDFLAQ